MPPVGIPNKRPHWACAPLPKGAAEANRNRKASPPAPTAPLRRPEGVPTDGIVPPGIFTIGVAGESQAFAKRPGKPVFPPVSTPGEDIFSAGTPTVMTNHALIIP